MTTNREDVGSGTETTSPLNVEEPSARYRLQVSEDDIVWSTSPSLKNRGLAYLQSEQGKEFLFCAAFGLVAYFVGYLWSIPNQRPIPFQFLQDSGTYILNLANDQEYVDSTVTEWHLGAVVLLCPLVQAICAMTYGMVGDVHKTLCIYCMAFPLTELTTWTIKVYVGYLRPNFYSLCQPDENYQYCTADGEWQDGRMSFPSGHASYSFCALTVLHLYLEQSFGITRVAGQFVPTATDPVKGPTWQEPPQVLRYRIGSILCLIPLALAIFIACSRVVDNKHFPADVVAGSLLGGSIARYFHFLWYVNPRRFAQ